MDRLHGHGRSAARTEWRLITAMLENGPLGSSSIEVAVIEGRPPKTIDVPADDQSTCRYCLAGWMQSGRSATYTFLYRV